MKLQMRKRRVNNLALAFCIPFFGMLLLMLIRGFSPFGQRSMLYSDMYHQYYPFFKAFRRALRSGDSLLYSWNVGMGVNYLGLIAYYLASPLNLLTVLLPESWMLGYFSLLTPIKLSLASLFFAWMLRELFGKDEPAIALFGAFYGLCAWALGYQWNIMWVDSFALLPLVCLGAVRLLRDKKVVLYTVTLFLSVFSNYYVGLFTCIFVFLLFFAYQICYCRSVGRFFADLMRIGVFSLLAIGMTVVLTLPALAALQTTQSSVNKFPTEFRLNLAEEHNWKGLLNGMRQVAGNMGGGLEPTFKEGLPNVYCGVGTVMLAALFLTCRDIKVRERLCALGLLLFIMVSFLIRQLDFIWHGFHFPNMIPYRFSFLYSFVLLYMAYKAWLRRKSFTVLQIVYGALIMILVILCSNDSGDGAYLAYNVGFLVLFLLAFGWGQLRRKVPKDADEVTVSKAKAYRAQCQKNSAILLMGVMALEIVMNLVNFGIRFPGTNTAYYPKGTTDTYAVVDFMHQRETGTPFYRAEVTHTQTLNDGALIGYNGITTFTSSANVRITEFMRALGYSAKNTYNRYSFEDSSPVAALFLNLKYMIEREPVVKDNRYFDAVYQSGNVTLLQNNAWLPLGFLADEALGEVDMLSPIAAFHLQNQLFQAATGLTENVWSVIGDENITVTPENTTLTGQMNRGRCSYRDTGSNASVTYTYDIQQDGFFCMYMDLSKRNSFTVTKNGRHLFTESVSLPQSFAVGDVAAGDSVVVRLNCKSGEDGTLDIRGGVMHHDVFQKGVEILSQTPLQLTHFSNTYVRGIVDAPRSGLLYTSIPDDGNWQVLVDGTSVEPVKVGGVMLSVPVTEGRHSITFRYHNAAFSLGWKISLLCLALFILLLCTMYRPWKRKGKYERMA